MSKYKKGEEVIGIITGIENYGIFISLEDDYSGLIHISELSSLFVKDVNEYGKVGEKIKAQVIEIDDNNKQIKLSIKNLNEQENKKKNQKIHETESGFSTLGSMLDVWISKKNAEISLKNEKN